MKLLIVDGLLVFGFDPSEFAYKRLVVIDGARGGVMAGDHSGKHLGEELSLDGHQLPRSPRSTTRATGSRTWASSSR